MGVTVWELTLIQAGRAISDAVLRLALTLDVATNHPEIDLYALTDLRGPDAAPAVTFDGDHRLIDFFPTVLEAGQVADLAAAEFLSEVVRPLTTPIRWQTDATGLTTGTLPAHDHTRWSVKIRPRTLPT